MKLTHFPVARLFSILPLLFTLSLVSAQAQETARIKLESLDRLASRATEVERKEEKARSGDGMVYVRHFEFKKAGDYHEADLQEIRAQLQGPGWSRFLKVEGKGDNPDEKENVEIYVFGKTEANNIYGGMTVIATEPKEFTVVNIVGQGDFNDLLKWAKTSQTIGTEKVSDANHPTLTAFLTSDR